MSTIITKDTLIPIGAVLVVLSAAFSYGIMYNKVANLSEDVASLREETKELRVDMKEMSTAVNQLLGKLNSVSYGGSPTVTID